jgi:hypothetical protein
MSPGGFQEQLGPEKKTLDHGITSNESNSVMLNPVMSAIR